MLTMPLAGALTGKIPVGRFVPVGLAVITGAMFSLTRITSITPYRVLIGTLFVMGLGMGATMTPVMTSALKTLAPHETARGSTLINIVRQVAGSVGVAVMPVPLTSHLKDSRCHCRRSARSRPPGAAARIGGPGGVARGWPARLTRPPARTG